MKKDESGSIVPTERIEGGDLYNTWPKSHAGRGFGDALWDPYKGS